MYRPFVQGNRQAGRRGQTSTQMVHQMRCSSGIVYLLVALAAGYFSGGVQADPTLPVPPSAVALNVSTEKPPRAGRTFLVGGVLGQGEFVRQVMRLYHGPSYRVVCNATIAAKQGAVAVRRSIKVITSINGWTTRALCKLRIPRSSAGRVLRVRLYLLRGADSGNHDAPSSVWKIRK